MTGKVKWFDKDKGYGFITPIGATATEQDVYVHISQVKRSGLETLAAQAMVSFETFQGKKSVAAKSITVIA